jgi:hypothetical protein
MDMHAGTITLLADISTHIGSLHRYRS